MARKKRLKFLNRKNYYHIYSRTVGGEFLLDTPEKKEKFISILKRLLKFFSIKTKEFVVLSNHFHLIIETCPEKHISDSQILKRALKANIYKSLVQKREIKKLKEKLTDISEFVKLLKQIFAQWYNRKFKRTGYFWGDRFKSILIQSGKYLLNCIYYVIFNPVRAKLVKNPEDYRYSSFFKSKNHKIKKENQLKYTKLEKQIAVIFKSSNTAFGDKNFLKLLSSLTN